MTKKIDWAPPPQRNPEIRIWKPTHEPRLFIVLGPPVGVWVHWLGKRSMPCERDKCPPSRHHKPCHWIGYAPAAMWDFGVSPAGHQWGKWIRIVLPLSEQIEPHFRVAEENYPSAPVKLKLAKSGRGIEILTVDKSGKPTELPGPFNVKPVLFRAWGIRPDQTTDHCGETE